MILKKNNKNSIFEYTTNVYYEDTDSSGFVYHASYLRFAERARSDMIKKIYPVMIKSFIEGKFLFVVKDLTVSYVKPCKLLDELLIKTKIVKITKCSLSLFQQISNNISICTKLNVKLVWINNISGKPSKIPLDLISRFNKLKIV
jgi:acyl-CoA thioester hydrolase